MTPNSERAIEVFTAAIQIPIEQRNEFLDQACAGEGGLRHKIEALLRSNERVECFLDKPAATIGEARLKTSVGEKPGDRIGRYMLLQQIGEGGCGVVFLAQQQEPVVRRVALKVIKPGMDTKSVIARFEAERQALALMDHQNIAHVFDAGATESGRPYFVMELGEGPKITDYCDKHSLPIGARLELFIQVCDAIQHAHQKGIIHRDIKPSNVLVTIGSDGKPMPKVIDFGIAKATGDQHLTDKTIFTAREMLIGTPAYMSPEQAVMASTEVDTRTDIYSLGALLYELLTGASPFDTRELLKAGFDEFRRIIRDKEPVWPSARLRTTVAAELVNISKHHGTGLPKLIREIRGDLDWIVMRALEKDRSRRYATVNGLAMDISRFLSGEAVLARPPSTCYRLRKLARRNRLLFGALSIIVATFVIGFVAVTVALTREQAARREADKSRQQAEADKTSSQQATRFLEEMLDGVAPSVARGRDTVMLKEILDKTVGRLDVELTNQPAIQADLQTRLGKVYLDLDQLPQSTAMLRKALTTRSKLFGEDSELASDVMFELGNVLSSESKYVEAEAYLRRALAARQKLFGEKSIKVAKCYEEFGEVFWDRQQLPEAEEMLQKSLALHRQLLGDNTPELGDTRMGLGSVRFAQGRYPEAEALFRQAMTNWEGVLSEDHPAIINCVNNLATVLSVQNKGVEAEALLRQAVAKRRKLYGEEHPAVANSLQNLARVLMRLNRLDEAAVTGREALAVARKVWGDTNPNVIERLHDLINVLLAQHKFEEIEPLFADMLPAKRELKPEYAGLLLERCEAYARRARWREAATDAATLLEHAQDNHEYYHTLVPLLVQLGDVAEYQKLCRTILNKFSGATEAVVADRMAKDCLILPSSGVDPGSVATLADVPISHKANGDVSPYFEFCKALAEFRLAHYEEALQWAQLATKGPFPHPEACSLAIMAMAQFKLSQLEKARASLADCNKVIEEQLPKLEQDLGTDWRDWIIAHTLQAEAKRMIEGEPSSPSAPSQPAQLVHP